MAVVIAIVLVLVGWGVYLFKNKSKQESNQQARTMKYDDPVLGEIELSVPPGQDESDVIELMETLSRGRKEPDHTHLIKAVSAGREGQDAVRDGRFDDAWRLFHEQKHHYRQHASNLQFPVQQMLSLDADVSESLANVLRLEKKHKQALVHIVYWVAAQQHKPKKEHDRKLRVYFNRAKLSTVELDDVWALVTSHKDRADFVAIQKTISGWE